MGDRDFGGFAKSPKHYTEQDLLRRGKQAVASRRVRQAVANGTLQKAEQCQLCGRFGKTVAHHYMGYDYPVQGMVDMPPMQC